MLETTKFSIFESFCQKSIFLAQFIFHILFVPVWSAQGLEKNGFFSGVEKTIFLRKMVRFFEISILAKANYL